MRLGLAASLQQRVLAHMKIKEERDERQKRAEISPIHNGSVTITPTAHIKTEGMCDVCSGFEAFLFEVPILLNMNFCYGFYSSNQHEKDITDCSASSTSQNSSAVRKSSK